jgi:hypothetical protein
VTGGMVGSGNAKIMVPDSVVVFVSSRR